MYCIAEKILFPFMVFTMYTTYFFIKIYFVSNFWIVSMFLSADSTSILSMTILNVKG